MNAYIPTMWFDRVALLLTIICVAFLSTYKLTESPPTWMDEGIIIQIAHNVAVHGVYGLQTAPGIFASPAHVSTGFPVILPIVLSFMLFGINLFSARLIMVLFIFGLFILVYLYMRQYGTRVAVWSMALLATFAPIYGQGKNVLGEVPGLFFLLLFLCLLRRLGDGFREKRLFVLLGLAGGLSVATKPIFLLLLPAFCVVAFVYRKSAQFSRQQYLLFFLSLIVPILAWMWLQFPETSLSSVLTFYSNPSSVNLVTAVRQNVIRFFAELQPAYTLFLFGIWLISLLYRYRTKKNVTPTELCACIFSLLIIIAYTRTMGVYRHFFTAEFLSLMYLPRALSTVNL